MSKNTDTLISKAASYTTSVYFAQLIGVVGSLLSKFFLGPLQVGIWGALQLIIDLTKYTTLGITAALSVEIPFYRGKGDLTKIEAIKNNVFSYLTVLSVLSMMLAPATAWLFKDNISSDFFWGLISLAAILPLQRFNNFVISLLRAEKDFTTAGKQVIYSAAINVFLIGVLTYKYKIFGFLAATGFSLLFNILYVQFKKKTQFHFIFNNKEIARLAKLGLPLEALSMIGHLFRSIDKIVILKYLGFAEMGLYSIAIMVCNYLSSLHNSVGVVLAPHFNEKKGKDISASELRKSYYDSVRAMSVYLPILIGFAIIGGELMVNLFLKEFTNGINAMQILALSVYFTALANLTTTYLIALRRHIVLIPILFIACLVAFTFNLFAVKSGYGLNGVALATLITVIINFYFMHFISSRNPKFSQAEIKLMFKLALSFIYMCLAIFLARTYTFGFQNIFFKFLISGFLFTALCTPYWYILINRYQLLCRVFNLLKINNYAD